VAKGIWKKMPCRTCGAATAASGAYSRTCRACWGVRNDARVGTCYLLEFPGTGVCKVGHTTDLARRLRSYVDATRVAWSRTGPLTACRAAEARIKRSTRAARAAPPWEFARDQQRQRRGRPAFSGHTELRHARDPRELEAIRAAYDAFLTAELTG
jgi:hypothetical protein